MSGSTIRGKAWVFGDDINTDQIIPGKYKFRIIDIGELAKHAMEGVDRDFSNKVSKNDIILAGKNFGCGSSREHAPLVLKQLGIGAVVASSFARIFYRNAINIGLPIVECEEIAGKVREGSLLEIDLEKGTIRDLGSSQQFKVKPLPGFLLQILKDGGLVEHFKKRGGSIWQNV